FVARPVLWGLAYKGEQGAFHALDLLQKELELAMMLTGTTTVPEIDESYVYTPVNRWVRHARAQNGQPRKLLAKL
ncbi:Hydroxyacid oxidase 1, partial [Coemansia erecta]